MAVQLSGAQADAVVSELRRQYKAGLAKVEARASGVWVRAEVAATAAAYRALGPQVETWATKLRRWAADGKRDDGTAYTWERWLEHGKVTLADAINTISAEAYDRGLFAAAQYTFQETARQVSNPLLWPAWMKWSAAAVAAGVVLALVLTARR